MENKEVCFRKIGIIIMRLFLVVFFILLTQSSFSQSISKQKMNSLSFMIGEWVGTSKLIQNDSVVKQVAALQTIRFDLNKSVIIIDLKSETLNLHTIISYNEKDKTYYYNPYSENGSRKLPAQLINNQFIVNSNNYKRFIFKKTGNKTFQEYGEKLVNGKWMKYFEDNFKDVSN